ncbi:complement C2-like [Solea senegalensis]|uniref:C3/C5 convertase n=2 Tax=Solea senegalensis TaxID=28829 RepID=A0AAV6Q1B6_SOLSE|nr:complement C2 isoform X1 [Solea senegalensis]KAG7479699.1 complement C2-like [Solea senegalensis]
MNFKSLLWILFFISVQDVTSYEDEYDDDYETYDDPKPLNCSTGESIKGGNVTYSQGGQEGSVLTYHCGLDKYPFPVSSRLCGADGQWSLMRSAGGKPVTRATCKDVLCPAQLQLDHGDFWPKDQWFRFGTTQNFSCMEGFTMYGSAHRKCTFSGEWTGTPPVCDNHADDCNDPGIPPGAKRSASSFHTGEKIVYQCQTGLDLLGSAERVCLENREWSGSTPRCQGPNTFDPPSAVAKAMAGSLAGVMDVVSSDFKKSAATASFGRTIHVSEGSHINVYILMDTSGSIRKEDFEKSRNATIALIRKLDSYEVQLKFHVLSFATEVKDIVDITQTYMSSSIEDVIWNLMEFDYHSHGRKTGTNLHSALHRVSEKISFFKQRGAKSRFNETQNIIIIETDGYANIGNKPQIAMGRIRQLLGYSLTSEDHTDETMLDVYVFGVGDQLNKKELNTLASKKRGEQHVFILKDYQTLGEVFNSIISDKSVTMCGVVQEHVSKEHESFGIPVYSKPWHVTLRAPEWGPKVSCFGSIMSQNWVLTAAHCFARASKDKVSYQVDIEHGDGRVRSSRVIMHPKYNTSALKHRNVSEFYDYDVALVHVNSIPLSWKARPICLPCTVPASRALKRINSTCQQHRAELLPHETTAAFFSHKNSGRKQTHIHTKGQRPDCVEKAWTTLKEPTDVTLREYVTDRFLCSGGTSGYQDAVTCKGDSGGPLFLPRRNRYFQVGVVSWGTTDVCDPRNSAQGRYSSDRPPPHARDFYIDVFEIMSWLKQHLGEQIQFLPEVQ